VQRDRRKLAHVRDHHERPESDGDNWADLASGNRNVRLGYNIRAVHVGDGRSAHWHVRRDYTPAERGEYFLWPDY
jgi:hypothetical protein